MIRLSFCLVLFHLHLLTVHQYVQSAAVFSNQDLHVIELVENGTLSVYCKQAIRETIFDLPSHEWCQRFDLVQDFIFDGNECDKAEYEIIKRAACGKGDPDFITSRTEMATMPTSHTSTPEYMLRTNMRTTQETQNTQSTSYPNIESTSTEKFLLWEQTKTPSHESTTTYQRRQTNGDMMSSSDTTINTRNIQNPGSTTAHDLFRTIESERTLENSLEDLLQQVQEYKNKTDHVDECKIAALTKLTRENDVVKLCATIKQLKGILDDKCVKTDYDLLVVETLQLFNCLVCPL